MAGIEAIIKSRIRERGRITFTEFMETALYYPGLGYYASAKDRVGADGDFYTSPATHPVFAALIAVQLEQMWQLLDCPREFWVVEMGAGKRLLARDVVRYLPFLSSTFAAALIYVTKEKDGTPTRLWPEPGEVKESLAGVIGCVISNELLDAMPVHRIVIQNEKLLEFYVTVKDGRFVDEPGDPSTPDLEKRLGAEGINLPEGYCTEINLGIAPWIDLASGVLGKGFVLTIDYGGPARKIYAPERRSGTLMTYYRHTTGTDPFIRVGSQDITSHVDFSAVVQAGERAGLYMEGLASQHDFLLNLGMDVFLEALTRKQLAYSDYLANRMAMLELLRPEVSFLRLYDHPVSS